MADYDVFISYAHLDRAGVEPIERALAGAELRVFRDTCIPTFSSISRSVEDALASSKSFLAYYSQNYRRSRPCQWELTTAFLSAPDPTQRIFVVNPESGFSHIDPFELRDALTPPSWVATPAALDALAADVAARVRVIDRPLGGTPRRPSPIWCGSRGIAAARFTGRTRELWALHSKLVKSDLALITGHAGPAHTQLRGMGGIGKSLLAEEYALRFARGYPGGIFWLSPQAWGGERISDDDSAEVTRLGIVRDLATRMGLETRDAAPAVVERMLVRRLSRRALPYLWIVDDLPAGLSERSRRRWLAPTAYGKTLITTRDRSRDGIGDVIDLDVLDDESAYELITSRTKPASPSEERAAAALAADLGNHALALDVAGGALAALAGGETFESLRRAIANSTRDVLPFLQGLGGELPNQAERNIVATLFRGYELLDKGRDFLRLASLVGPDAIPPDLVRAVFEELGERDPFSGARAADDAVMHSFAERADASRGGWIVHTLVARTASFHETDLPRRARVRAAAVAALTAILQAATDADGNVRVLAHAAHARHLLGEQIATVDEIRLLACIGAHEQNLGAYESAQRSQEHAVVCARRLLGEDDEETLHLMSGLAWTARLRGKLADAHAALSEIVRKQSRVVGADHELTQVSRQFLASTLHALGRLPEAHRAFEELVALRRRLRGPDDPETLRSMAGFAAVLRAESHLAQAREIEEHVRDVRLLRLGPDHPDTILAKNELAETLRAMGHLDDALGLGEEVLAAWTKLWGAEHPSTLTAMCNLAFTLWACGGAERVGKARELEEQVVVLRSRVLGDDHLDTLLARNNLGSTLRALGDPAGARQQHELALAGRTRRLGLHHLDTLQSMNNLALALVQLRELRRARDLQERVLDGRIRVYRSGHPEILRAAWNLLITVRGAGDAPAAHELESRFIKPLFEKPLSSLDVTEAEVRTLWERAHA